MIVVRHSEPTILDALPFGSQCRVPRSNKLSYDLYVQISRDEENPKWEYGGYFLTAEKDEEVKTWIDAKLQRVK